MNMKSNKLKIISAAVLCVLVFLIGYLRQVESRYSLEIIQVKDNGYGYKILEGKRTIIVQPFIPVVAGKECFKTREDSENIGNLVLKRIESGENFSVTWDDLKQLNICMSD